MKYRYCVPRNSPKFNMSVPGAAEFGIKWTPQVSDDESAFQSAGNVEQVRKLLTFVKADVIWSQPVQKGPYPAESGKGNCVEMQQHVAVVHQAARPFIMVGSLLASVLNVPLWAAVTIGIAGEVVNEAVTSDEMDTEFDVSAKLCTECDPTGKKWRVVVVEKVIQITYKGADGSKNQDADGMAEGNQGISPFVPAYCTCNR